jgi:predicted P-loop ATPase/GTPase
VAKVRELYTVKNDVPETLAVFVAFIVNPANTTYSSTKVVLTSSKTALNLINGEQYRLGVDAFLDPEDALQFLRKVNVREMGFREGKIALIDAALEKLKAVKQEEKNNAK